MSSRLDIYPCVGIGPIRFGMRPAQVYAVFNEPNLWEEWMGGNHNGNLLYHGLVLFFDNSTSSDLPPPHSKLFQIDIHDREDAYLFDRPMKEWTRDSVLQELLARGYAAETPDYGEVYNDVEVDRLLCLAFEDDGRLSWVEFYPCESTTV